MPCERKDDIHPYIWSFGVAVWRIGSKKEENLDDDVVVSTVKCLGCCITLYLRLLQTVNLFSQQEPFSETAAVLLRHPGICPV